MMSNALYYPYIRVPENPWFTRVLLYCDTVGAIVPSEYIEDPDRLGEYMVGLVRENLVQQVVPGMHLWKVNNFTDSFLEHVDAKYGENGRPAEWASVHSEKLGSSSVHVEKLHDLADRLCERGLAKRDENTPHSPWLKIEAKIADDFMAYLAGVLGQITDDCNFLPITNQHHGLRPFIGQGPQDAEERVKLRELLLEGILPSPTGSIEPARLHDFKVGHVDELKRFRKHVEATISELAANPDEQRRSVRLSDITGDFRATIDELVARMNEQKGWPRLDFGTLCVVVGSSMGAWKAAMDENWIFGVTGAALSLAPAVYRAFRGSDLNLEDRPLAYAALSQREFGQHTA